MGSRSATLPPAKLPDKVVRQQLSRVLASKTFSQVERLTARDLNLTISGSGAYEGEQMKSTRATVKVTGSGAAVVAASETLIVQVTGSGSVEYVGEPKLTQQLSGSGSVRKR